MAAQQIENNLESKSSKTKRCKARQWERGMRGEEEDRAELCSKRTLDIKDRLMR